MSQTLPDRTVPEMLSERTTASPGNPAFCFEVADRAWAPISWGDFDARVNRVAAGLLDQGLRKGDRLALIAPVSLEWELLHHAALRTGIIVVGLDAHDLPARLAAMCDTADITAVATTNTALLTALTPERMQRLRCVITLSPSDPLPPGMAARSVQQRLEALEGTGAAADLPGPSPSDTATIIFTSGTTGDPKGIAYSHAQLCLAIEVIAGAFPFVGAGSRLLCWLPLSNLFQRMVNLAGMRQGAASYLLCDPRRVMDVVADVSPDIFIGVPRFYEKLYQGVQARIRRLPPWRRMLAERSWTVARRAAAFKLAGQPTPFGLRLSHRLLNRIVLSRIRETMGKRLRCMITGSAPTPTYLLHDFFAIGWLVLECYGLSENVLPMAMNLVNDFEFGTVGRPMAGNDIKITHERQITVRGPGLFSGYLESGGRIYADSSDYYHTGDVGFIDASGRLRLIGRTDDIVKTSTGKKVNLHTIEAALRAVAGVLDAAVIADGRRFPVAICTTDENIHEPLTRESLVQRLVGAARRLTEHERPRAIFLRNTIFSVETGEITGNLKLRRKVIEQNFSTEIELMYASPPGIASPDPRFFFAL
jgi:long-chain acyl-CoA synthetase